MDLSALTAISPLDGRYARKLGAAREYFSEYGLVRMRVQMEVRWLQFLAQSDDVPELGHFSTAVNQQLDELVERFGTAEAERVKQLEAQTNHDVKAVEYYLNERFAEHAELQSVCSFVHFGCTSEDVNNIAHALILQAGRQDLLLPALDELIGKLKLLAEAYADSAMLSRTHGQAASPTTLGKEVVNIAARLKRQRDQFAAVEILAKLNGAVGNFNAHHAAFPAADWASLSEAFVASLGLTPNVYTTQIEPHDWVAEYCDALARINTVLLDASRDFWGYISLGYLGQRKVDGEVGSSTMPHKVNPIDFENAEGNLGLANALLQHFSEKLPVSRWQRDLSDSTVQRNLGVACSHSLLAYLSLRTGLDKVEANPAAMLKDLEDRWEVLGEAVQTVMRRAGHADAYEQLKAMTRGTGIDASVLHNFIRELDIPAADKERLLALRPADYVGLAGELARRFLAE